MTSAAEGVPTRATKDPSRRWRLLWAASLLFIFYALTLPFAFVGDPGEIRQHWAEALERSRFAHFDQLSRTDVVQNVLLFVPIGFLGVGSFFRSRRVGALFIAISVAAALSSACELLQLLTSDRITSIWDVWANVTGAIAGGVLWLALRPIGLRLRHSLPDTALERKRAYLLWCATAVVVIAAWEPFDFTLDVGSVWTKVKASLANEPWLWASISDELLTSLRFSLLSFLSAEWLGHSKKDVPAARATAFAAAAALAVTLEATQFIIASRSPSIQDLLAACSGALLGVALAPRLLRMLSPATVAVTATAIAAVPFYLQPFSVAFQYTFIGTTPFLAYYQRTSLQTVSHVVGLMLIFAPVGFAMVWSRSKGSVRHAALMVLAIAAPLEYAQGWIVGRYPDVTDLGIAVLGGLVGAVIARVETDRAELVPGSPRH